MVDAAFEVFDLGGPLSSLCRVLCLTLCAEGGQAYITLVERLWLYLHVS